MFLVCNFQRISSRESLEKQRALNRSNTQHYQESMQGNIDTIQQLHKQVCNLQKRASCIDSFLLYCMKYICRKALA